jgi:hypothetical protein
VAKAAAERDFHRLDAVNPKVDQYPAEKAIAAVESIQATHSLRKTWARNVTVHQAMLSFFFLRPESGGEPLDGPA